MIKRNWTKMLSDLGRQDQSWRLEDRRLRDDDAEPTGAPVDSILASNPRGLGGWLASTRDHFELAGDPTDSILASNPGWRRFLETLAIGAWRIGKHMENVRLIRLI